MIISTKTIKQYGNPKYKEGQLVTFDNNTYTVKSVSHNGSVYLYSFDETEMSCGEYYLKPYQSKEEKQELLIANIKRLIDFNQKGIDRIKEELNTHFNYTFKWKAEEIFKLDFETSHLNVIVDYANPQGRIKGYIQEFTDEIERGKFANNSTSVTHNLGYIWELECKSSMLKLFKELLK